MRIYHARLLTASTLLLAAACPALAQVPARRGAHILFVAPSGKPYRGQPGAPYPVAAWFAAADADHDGRLTLAEYRADFMAFFAELDADHDGEIGPDEITHYEEAVLPEVRVSALAFDGVESMTEKSDDSGDAPAPRGPSIDLPRGAGAFSFFNTPEPIIAMDTNFNRGVSRAEFATAADRSFHILDASSHGYLTLETLPKTPIQQGARLGGTGGGHGGRRHRRPGGEG